MRILFILCILSVNVETAQRDDGNFEDLLRWARFLPVNITFSQYTVGILEGFIHFAHFPRNRNEFLIYTAANFGDFIG